MSGDDVFSEWDKKSHEQVEKLEAKIKKLKNKATTTKAAAREKARKSDTRRKVLLGAWVMETMKKDGEFAEMVKKSLSGFLERKADRALFGMEPLPGGAAGGGGDEASGG